MTGVLFQTGPGNETVDEELVESLTGLGWQDWVAAVAILVIGLVAARLSGRVIQRGLVRAGAGQFIALVLARTTTFVIALLAFYFAFAALDVSVGPLIGALGLAGLALALAFQDILENVVAGVLMLIRRPIAPGDEIETNGYLGRVVDLNLRSVRLRTLDGDTVMVPNSMVWKNPITNLTDTGDRRTTVEVGVAYASDLDRAKLVLEAAVAGVDGVLEYPAPEALVFEFGESSIDFAVRYWHASPTATMWRVRDAVAREIARALRQAGIEIPFPQRVVHLPRPSTED